SLLPFLDCVGSGFIRARVLGSLLRVGNFAFRELAFDGGRLDRWRGGFAALKGLSAFEGSDLAANRDSFRSDRYSGTRLSAKPGDRGPRRFGRGLYANLRPDNRPRNSRRPERDVSGPLLYFRTRSSFLQSVLSGLAG